MPHRLGFHEGLTAVVGWNKGVVAQPTEADKALGFLASNWPLAIPIPVFLGMFALWRRVGRDPKRLPVAVQYEPPDSLTPAEAGTLMDYSADMRDITATLVDLAVRGHLRIEERDESVLLGLFKRREYVFRRLDPPGERAPWSRTSGMFSAGSSPTEAPRSSSPTWRTSSIGTFRASGKTSSRDSSAGDSTARDPTRSEATGSRVPSSLASSSSALAPCSLRDSA